MSGCLLEEGWERGILEISLKPQDVPHFLSYVIYISWDCRHRPLERRTRPSFEEILVSLIPLTFQPPWAQKLTHFGAARLCKLMHKSWDIVLLEVVKGSLLWNASNRSPELFRTSRIAVKIYTSERLEWFLAGRYNFACLHFITISLMFQNSLLPFQKKSWHLLTLIPSYFLHKSILEAELKDILQAKTQSQTLSPLLLL